MPAKVFSHNFFRVKRNNPTVELGFLNDLEDLENVSEMVAETSAASKDEQSEVLPVKTTASQIYPSGIWRKKLEDKQSNNTKKNTNGCVSTFKGEFQT